MADKINFSKKLNTSVQIGDELWYSNISSGTPTTPTSLGTILETGDKWVKINSAVGTADQTNLDLITNGGFDVVYGANKVLNGTFDADILSWDHLGGMSDDPLVNPSIYWDAGSGNGRMYLNQVWFHTGNTPSTNDGYINQTIATLTQGNDYRITFDYEIVNGTGTFDVGNAFVAGVSLSGTAGIINTYDQVFTALTDTLTMGFYGIAANSSSFYIDNVSVEQILPATDWYTDGTWDILGQDKAIKIPGTAGYLYQDYATSLVEGEEYTLTMDIVGGSGNIQIVNTTIPNDVDVAVDPSTNIGTATWIQSSVNTDKINIHQDGAGDIEIDNIELYMTSFDLATALGGTTPENLFFMFRKPVAENVSSLKGYYAESTFTNNSTAKQELFAVGSEVTISSK